MNRFSRRRLGATTAVTAALLLGACAASAQDGWLDRGRDLLGGLSGSGVSDLTEDEMSGGLREALRVGTERVVAQLGRPGGFASDPAIRIPLPDALEKARGLMAGVGMSGMLDDLELELNEAAELATPKAKQLFVDAIAAMTVSDAKEILTGADDAATRYFQGKMSAPLAEEMAPVVKTSLSEVGAVRQYDALLARYQAIPFAPALDVDLTTYVVEKGMDGIFHYLAIQEQEIRENPAARSTELLQKVFGSL